MGALEDSQPNKMLSSSTYRTIDSREINECKIGKFANSLWKTSEKLPDIPAVLDTAYWNHSCSCSN